MLSKLNLDRLGRKTFLYLVSVKYNTNCRLNVELLSGKAEPMNGFTIIYITAYVTPIAALLVLMVVNRISVMSEHFLG